MENIPTGALLDERPEEKKALDWLHEELAAGASPFEWEERKPKDHYFFPHDQASSLSCVAGYGAIIDEFYNGVIGSRKDMYVRRSNRPQGGMAMNDAASILRAGLATEQQVPSQGLGERAMNEEYPITGAIAESRASGAMEAWVSIAACRSIDAIAEAAAKAPVMCFWFFDISGAEWWRQQPTIIHPNLDLYDNGTTARHQVAIVDAVLIDGKKFLVGQDTAGVGTGFGKDRNLRLISEEMVSKRCYSAGYAIDRPNAVIPPKPRFRFERSLKLGMSGDDVRALQEILKYEGCITLEVATRFFGAITLAGVKRLQQKYASEILAPAGLRLPTGFVGKHTISFLNKKYE